MRKKVDQLVGHSESAVKQIQIIAGKKKVSWGLAVLAWNAAKVLCKGMINQGTNADEIRVMNKQMDAANYVLPSLTSIQRERRMN